MHFQFWRILFNVFLLSDHYRWTSWYWYDDGIQMGRLVMEWGFLSADELVEVEAEKAEQ